MIPNIEFVGIIIKFLVSLLGVSEAISTRDLQELVKKGIFEKPE